MHIKYFFILHSMIILYSSAVKQVKNVELMKAIKIIFRDVYSSDAMSPNVVFLSENSWNDSDELFQSLINDDLPRFCLSSIDLLDHFKKSVAIVITDTLGYSLIRKLSHASSFVLLVLSNCDEMAMKRLLVLKKIIIVRKCNENIQFLTLKPFGNEFCSNKKLLKIISYENGSFASNLRKSIDLALKPVNECSVNASILLKAPFAYYQESLFIKYLIGSDVKITKEIYESLNMNVSFHIENSGKSTPNNASMFIGYYPLHVNFTNPLKMSIPYDFCELVYIVPPGYKITSLEKLFQAFDGKIWILICLIILMAFISTHAINTQSIRIRRFIFGRATTLAFMNVLGGLLGTSSHQLVSKRNFIRILWIAFLLFGVLMRTLHQATLFKLLQNNENKKEVQSLDEAIHRNFVVYTDAKYKYYVNASFRIEEIDQQNIEKIITKSYSSDFAGIILMPLVQTKYFNSKTDTTRRLNFIKHPRIVIPAVFYFSEDFQFVNEVNKKIERFHSAGLIKYWTDLETTFIHKVKTEIVPTELTLNQVTILFNILGTGYFIALCSFICEVVYHKFVKRTKPTKTRFKKNLNVRSKSLP